MDNDEFQPTPEHQALCTQVEALLEKWRWLPWVQPWHITIQPIPQNTEDFHTMEIQMMGYIRCAKLCVAPDAGVDHTGMFPQGEYSLELTLLHELCHLLFDPFRTQAFNFALAGGELPAPVYHVLETEEEMAVWALCRTLATLSRQLDLKDLNENGILLGPGLVPGRQRRASARKSKSGAGASA